MYIYTYNCVSIYVHGFVYLCIHRHSIYTQNNFEVVGPLHAVAWYPHRTVDLTFLSAPWPWNHWSNVGPGGVPPSAAGQRFLDWIEQCHNVCCAAKWVQWNSQKNGLKVKLRVFLVVARNDLQIRQKSLDLQLAVYSWDFKRRVLGPMLCSRSWDEFQYYPVVRRERPGKNWGIHIP